MGIFITIDGPNGVGKSTFIEFLSSMISKKYKVYITKEPTNTEFGIKLRKNEENQQGLEYAKLIAEDRKVHVKEEIESAKNKNDIILCDRYIDSSLVFQVYDGLSMDEVWALNSQITIPDISIILLAKPELLEERLNARKYLTHYEKTMTRTEEVERYKEASDFLIKKGFNVIIYENNFMEDQKSNIKNALSSIINLL